MSVRSPHRSSYLRQRGLSLLGLLFWAVLVGMLAVLAMKVLPTMNEYFTIQRAVQKIADSGTNTAPEIRKAFQAQQDVEYSISTIGADDLQIDTSGDHVKISFAYDKQIELFDPVYLLIKYHGGNR
ncbi:DUF4845 domain-containing protein [Ideonella sp. B7]|uniref:DUF4845 domain-containing protein n=1 Tax=Ideonella benzenivorans TaxID=2831643 RepID=UPI001CECB375|nr:DUF4845 domain-containing protein [Ideonella benzenivorans]MCA6216813.1 DUF4845 domain-containing protein [Ideonella benzenivorans]